MRKPNGLEQVRIYEIAPCKMVSSPCASFENGGLDEFDAWLTSQPHTTFPRDFLYYDKDRGGFVWLYEYTDGMHFPESFSIVDFPGGLYAVATGVDGMDNGGVIRAIRTFINNSGCFAEDKGRRQLGNIITPASAQRAMGYAQMDYYIPVKIK